MDRSPVHAMTCDVEDYFQVSAFEGLIPRERWSEVECRVPRNIDNALQLLADNDATATFFSLGWVATQFPEVVRRIADQGHEVASHGMQHTRVWEQQPDEFFEDAATARKLLEEVSGTQVKGYRAASWSIDGRTPWAHDVLAEAGYQYSSSIYPVSHDHYGMPDAPREPYQQNGLLEVPASTAKLLGRNIPAAGGGYFRLYPLWISRRLISRHQDAADYPFVFYFHPWELDADQPRMAGASRISRFRHYLNLEKFESRLAALLREFRWGRMDEIYLGDEQ